jgi:hypothetical protein
MIMRKFALAIVISGLIFPTVVSAMSDAPKMPEWMVGVWEHADAQGWADEYWTPLRGDLMLGSARSGKDERLKFWEQMRIQREEDGAVVLWVVSADQKPVRFEAVVSGENTMTFENAYHDYPQRIHYWRAGKTLKAEISLIDGSKAVQFSYRLKRAGM